MDLVLKALLLLGNLVTLVAIPIIPSTRNINEAVSEIIIDYNGASAGKYLYRLFQNGDQEHLFRRDLSAAIQGDTGLSGDTEKLHKQECLECIFTLLPTPKI